MKSLNAQEFQQLSLMRLGNFLILFFSVMQILGINPSKASSVSNQKVRGAGDHFLVKPLDLRAKKSKFLLVALWAPNCESCGQEVTVLNALAQNSKMATSDLNVLGVPVAGRPRAISEFISHFKPIYEQIEITDPQAKKNILALGGVPVTLLFNSQRNLIKQWSGKLTAADVIETINHQKGGGSL